ncbi:heterokaryon incompatibility protein-domain-containing protein [Parachaetomium inaequale]|uniref:Heterokaryon incompatibility protein-domain-containing protein n=1 Tax=Parachaetomium inaequale TaxID=2588326 RepID=A0AAN6P6A4_9PEZI|nr:heterokaryon incompatibility protein-domain-containing protein [Parachaetomium inaequale]
MLCETCLQLPLDPFLPHKAWGSYRNGRAWFGNAIVRDGGDCVDQLRKSSEAGCHLCTVFLGALDDAEPFWATNEFTGSDHDQLLHAPRQRREESSLLSALQIGVRKEGEALITDGQRTAGVYWELESLKYGEKKLPVHDRADCDENFTLAKSWLETCVQQHDACRAGSEPEFLPTRLIHVGDPAQGRLPRLVRTALFPFPEHTQYLALSHCWGTDRGKTVAKTTTATLPALLDGIDVEGLPKTFLDAMEVVRRVGHRYLWIDSLCIIQDDRKDFEVECSRMHLVYSQALCTIVASDSPDGDGGCFLPRDPRKISPCVVTLKNLRRPYYRTDGIMDVIRERPVAEEPDEAQVTVYPNFGPWVKSIKRGAVFGRGWCLQEREMSPRALHYTRDRLLWECRECTASEDGRQAAMEPKKTANEALARHLSSFRVMDDAALHVVSQQANRVQLKSHKWDRLAEAYSRRRLSVATDKLPAISGMARVLADRLPGDEYLAGIWKGNLLKGLSWFPSRGSRGLPAPVPAETWPPSPVDAGIPSWSWAAYDGPIAFVGDSWFSGGWGTIVGPDGKDKWVKIGPEIVVKSASVTHDSEDTFGRVSGGELVLEGWTAELVLSEACLVAESDATAEQSKKPPFPSKCYNASVDEVPVVAVFFDYDVAELPLDTTVLCLQLGTGISVRGGNPKVDTGLALVEEEGGSFRRVGMFELVGNKSLWLDMRKRETVRIV